MKKNGKRQVPLIATLCGALAFNAVSAAANSAAKDALEPARAALRTLQFERALGLLDTAQRSGNLDAEYLLGLLYLNGVGTAVDVPRGRQLIRGAAEHGHSAAQFAWAGELMRGAVPDPAESRRWLELSARQRYARATDALKSNKPLLYRQSLGAIEPSLFTAWVLNCVRAGNVAELRRLGPKAAAVSDEFGRSALAYAVAAGSIASAAALLELGGEVGASDAAGTTALMLAAKRGDASMMALLLMHGANVQMRDAEQRSALFYAARANHAAAVDVLITAGAALEARDTAGNNALDTALAVGAEDAAARLRALGLHTDRSFADAARPPEKFDPNHLGELYRGWSTLAIAIARNDAAATKKMLEAGADVNQRSPQGDSLLKIASDSHAMQVIPLLITHHAESLRADNSGHSLLWILATRNDGTALKALLDAGVAADTRSAAEATPLMAALRSGHTDLVNMLLGFGADPNLADARGNSPLMLASAAGAMKAVELLLEHHANVDAKDQERRTAVFYAASGAPRAVLEALLRAGANPKLLDAYGDTPLHLAASRANADVAFAMMAGGVDVNAQDERGDTPLILAAAAGRADTVKILLAAKPPLDTQDKSGDTALIAASRGGYQPICQMLLSAGANPSLRNASGISAADETKARGFPALAAQSSSH